MPARSAVALLSGGLDSSVATALWLEGGGRVVLALTFDYGQRAAAAEAGAARALAARLGVPWRTVALPWLAEAAAEAGSALVAREEALPAGSLDRPGDEASAARVWVPARNVVLVAAAASFAEALGAGCVLAGFNREEAETFADNSKTFLEAMTAALSLGTRSGVVAEAPTADLDKAGIVAAARRLGIGRGDVWSCYGPGPRPCGRCESCLRSRRAWEA